MSWAPQVKVGGIWSGNGLRFATQQEAHGNVRDLFMRWTLVEDTRTVESPDPVNYAWVDGHLVNLEGTVK